MADAPSVQEIRLRCVEAAATLPGVSAVDAAEAGRRVVAVAAALEDFVVKGKSSAASGPNTLSLPKKN